MLATRRCVRHLIVVLFALKDLGWRASKDERHVDVDLGGFV